MSTHRVCRRARTSSCILVVGEAALGQALFHRDGTAIGRHFTHPEPGLKFAVGAPWLRQRQLLTQQVRAVGLRVCRCHHAAAAIDDPACCCCRSNCANAPGRSSRLTPSWPGPRLPRPPPRCALTHSPAPAQHARTCGGHLLVRVRRTLRPAALGLEHSSTRDTSARANLRRTHAREGDGGKEGGGLLVCGLGG